MSNKYQLSKKKVYAIRNISHGVYVLSFKRDFTFSAGQVVAIDVILNDNPRLYSIAGGENDEFVEILFDEKKNGRLTPFLSKLKPGDYFYVSAPFGTFHSTNKAAYFIASGTGIAPFLSMIRSGNHIHKTIVHGGRMDVNFYYSYEIEEIMKDRYYRCCSQQEDTKYYNGRLTQWLKSQNNLILDCNYYLCGSPEMVVQVRDILIEKKIPFHNIISETYF